MTDRVKESLFELIQDDLTEKRIADVFAGTGTLGLEALSRGARSVVFIESDRQAFDLLRQNVATLGVEEETLCWRTDALRTSFRPKGVPDKIPFDLVFFDPPYRMIDELEPGSWLFKSLERLAREDVTSPDVTLLLRTPEHSEFHMPPCWNPLEVLDFSTMRIHIYKKRATES